METPFTHAAFKPDAAFTSAAERFFELLKTFGMPGAAAASADRDWSSLAGPLAGQFEQWLKRDRKSTRLNSSHLVTSYAVFCLKTNDDDATWALVPGSDRFFHLAIGQMAIDNAGPPLVPIASSIRGVSSLASGALSSRSPDHPL